MSIVGEIARAEARFGVWRSVASARSASVEWIQCWDRRVSDRQQRPWDGGRVIDTQRLGKRWADALNAADGRQGTLV